MRSRKSSPSNDLDPASREFDKWVTKNHMITPNYLVDQIGILIQSRKQVYESCCVTESYHALESTDIQDPACLDRSPRKTLCDYDCQSIPFYEKQEGSIRGLAERGSYWNIESIESPDSTEKDEDQQTPKNPMKPDIFSITQQQQPQSSSASSSSSSSCQSPIAPTLVIETPTINAGYAPKKTQTAMKRSLKSPPRVHQFGD